MAAGRDIARHTALIRRQQQERNLQAIREAEQRRTEQETLSALSPGEIRKRANIARLAPSSSPATKVQGHRIIPLPPPPEKLDRGLYEDKMDRGPGAEDKGPIPEATNFTILPPEEDAGQGLAPGHEDFGEAPEEGEAGQDDQPETLTYEGVAFASSSARELAETLPRITPAILGDFEPSSPKGFTKADIRDIDQMLAAEEGGAEL